MNEIMTAIKVVMAFSKNEKVHYSLPCDFINMSKEHRVYMHANCMHIRSVPSHHSCCFFLVNRYVLEIVFRPISKLKFNKVMFLK